MEIDFTAARTLWLALPTAAALAVAVWTYKRTYPPVGRLYRWMLLALRSSAVLLVGLLVFEPVLGLTRRVTRPERVALLVDRSASMLLPLSADGSGDSRLEWAMAAVDSATRAGGGPEVFYFGEELAQPRQGATDTLPEPEGRTDLASALDALTGPGGQDWDRIHVVSDGRVNSGKDPLLEAGGLPPVNTLLAARTPGAFDLALSRMELVSPAYEQEEVEIELSVAVNTPAGADGPGSDAVCDFYLDGRKVAEKRLQPGTTGFAGAVASFRAPAAGDYWLRAVLRPLEGEWTAINNERIMRLRVEAGRKRALVVTTSPDWDISFLQRALGEGDDWSVETVLVLGGGPGSRTVRRRTENGAFRAGALPDGDELDGVRLLVLHGVVDNLDRTFLERVARRAARGGLGLVFWPAGRVRLSGIPDELGPWLPFHALEQDLVPEPAPDAPSVLNTTGANGILAGLSGRMVSGGLPPVEWVYRTPPFAGGSEVLATAGRSGQGERGGRPLIVAGPGDATRTAVVLAQGLWRWHMRALEGVEAPDDRYYRIWGELAEWLSSGERRGGLLVGPEKDVFQRGEPVAFSGSVSDEAGNRIAAEGEAVELLITSERDDGAADTVFSGTAGVGNDGSFRLDAGRPGPGIYRYEARYAAGAGEDTRSAGGEFGVEQFSPEMVTASPDSALMAALARATGGEAGGPGQGGEIARMEAGETEETVLGTAALAHNGWVYALIILLLTAEWALRRVRALA